MSLLWELYGDGVLEQNDVKPVADFCVSDRHMLVQMLERGVNAPLTTSAGRLFDGVAALLDLYQVVTYEGQAAMALEFAADACVSDSYPFPLIAAADRHKPVGRALNPPLPSRA